MVAAMRILRDRPVDPRRRVPVSLVVALALVVSNAAAQKAKPETIHLPHPSGKYGVARIAYDWVDATRADTFSKVSGAHREMMVYVWYPTRRNLSGGSVADYVPNAGKIAAKLANDELQDGWGSSWRKIFAKKVVTDTHEQGPVLTGGERFPLLIFSPGQGVPVSSYTTLLQEVVSRGYVVASIEPTYESPAVGFPDGRVIRSVPEASENRKILPGESRKDFLQRQHAQEAPHLERLAADVLFVIDQLNVEAKRKVAPFVGETDFANLGAWGHSIGGRAAVRACQLDARIEACLNGDGAGPEGPIFSYQGAISIRQPFMWLETTPLPPPGDDALVRYQITREEWEKEHEKRLAKCERDLRSSLSGSYHVTITRSGLDHNSFTDWRMLEATDKGDFEKGVSALEPLEEYVMAFFDKYLKSDQHTILDEQRAGAGISVQKYRGVR